MANQTKHIVHAMFKWAKQPGRKFVAVNPFADLAAPGGAKVTRDRFLTAAEIKQVWRALDEPERLDVSRETACALRLILVTAARPGMVRGMVGSELRDLKIQIDPMITHVMPLAEINNAFELMKRGESIRGVVTF